MNKTKQILIRIDEELRQEFTDHCKEHGLSVSARLRVLISRDIERKRNNSL